jgi:hypothetical protein
LDVLPGFHPFRHSGEPENENQNVGHRLPAPLVVAFSVLAESRVALVIGSGAYIHIGQLRNPVHDARAIAAALTGLEYSVRLVTDATKSGMDAALDKFAAVAHGAEHAVVLYSGHGIEVRGVNYLLPIDAQNITKVTILLQAIRYLRSWTSLTPDSPTQQRFRRP